MCRRRLTVKALVAVDYSQPAIWLGLGLIAGGLSLYQLRRVTPVLSRDLDVVISSVVIFSGGILIFQVSYLMFAHQSVRRKAQRLDWPNIDCIVEMTVLYVISTGVTQAIFVSL